MKNYMNIRLPRDQVYAIAEDIDQVLEMWRLAFVERRPLEAAEWRTGMNMMIQIKVACTEAIRQEEAND